VYGYHLTRWTGTLFLFGIAVGAVVSLGLWLLHPRPAASRAADARRAAARLHREMAFINRDRDTRLEHQLRADRTMARR
jgi:hypothetical protein